MLATQLAVAKESDISLRVLIDALMLHWQLNTRTFMLDIKSYGCMAKAGNEGIEWHFN